MLLQGLLVDLREDGVEGVLIEHALAVVILDHLHRGLALAEAGDVDAALELVVGGLQALLELFGLHHEAELHLVGRELFKSRRHGISS